MQFHEDHPDGTRTASDSTSPRNPTSVRGRSGRAYGFAKETYPGALARWPGLSMLFERGPTIVIALSCPCTMPFTITVIASGGCWWRRWLQEEKVVQEWVGLPADGQCLIVPVIVRAPPYENINGALWCFAGSGFDKAGYARHRVRQSPESCRCSQPRPHARVSNHDHDCNSSLSTSSPQHLLLDGG